MTIIAVVGILTNFLFFLFVPGIVIYLLIHRDFRIFKKKEAYLIPLFSGLSLVFTLLLEKGIGGIETNLDLISPVFSTTNLKFIFSVINQWHPLLIIGVIISLYISFIQRDVRYLAIIAITSLFVQSIMLNKVMPRFIFYLSPIYVILASIGFYYLITLFISNNKLKKISIFLVVIILFFPILNTEKNLDYEVSNPVLYHFRLPSNFRDANNFLNEHIKPQDVIISTELVATYNYLDLDDDYKTYWITRPERIAFIINGTNKYDIYTNSQILSETSQLQKLLEENNRVWVVTNNKYFLWEYTTPCELKEYIENNSRLVFGFDTKSVKCDYNLRNLMDNLDKSSVFLIDKNDKL